MERVGRVELRIIGLEDRWAPLATIYPHCLVAGDRFELPILLAYETGVVTTLPASVFIIVKHTIRWPITHRNSFSQDSVFYNNANG